MKFVKNTLKALSLLVVSLFIMLAQPQTNLASAVPCEPEADILGIPTWYKYLEGETDVPGQCRPNIDTSSDALPIGLAIFEIMLTLGGLVAVVMIFIGAFKYVITVGEPDKANDARQTVINALVGLAIVLISARVVSFIAGRIT